MRRLFAVVGLVVVLGAILAPTAMAVRYQLPLPRAKHIARELSEYLCEETCTRYGWQCEPAGSGAACLVSNEMLEERGTIRCETVLHLVVGAGGYLHERYGHPHCFYVE